MSRSKAVYRNPGHPDGLTEIVRKSTGARGKLLKIHKQEQKLYRRPPDGRGTATEGAAADVSNKATRMDDNLLYKTFGTVQKASIRDIGRDYDAKKQQKINEGLLPRRSYKSQLIVPDHPNYIPKRANNRAAIAKHNASIEAAQQAERQKNARYAAMYAARTKPPGGRMKTT